MQEHSAYWHHLMKKGFVVICDTLAAPETYRVSSKNGIRSNQFEIRENILP